MRKPSDSFAYSGRAFRRTLLLGSIVLLTLSACGRDASNGAPERVTPVTAAVSSMETVERLERVVGRLETNTAPAVAAETGGRVVRVAVDTGERVEAGQVLAELDAGDQRLAQQSADAQVRRLQALYATQQVNTRRIQDLAARQSVSEDQLDQANAQLASLRAQLEAAQSNAEQAALELARTRITAPVSGQVQARHVSAGDFVSAGQVVFELVGADALQAIVPLPEQRADDLILGQVVRLQIPSRPDEVIEASVTEIRPLIGARSRAIEAVVALDNPGGWRVGGSVNAEVILASYEAVVVPQLSVVRRPAGTVVYRVVDEDGETRARQTLVEVGQRGEGWIEIRAGLNADEQVVEDGAAFLSDGALLDVSAGDEA